MNDYSKQQRLVMKWQRAAPDWFAKAYWKDFTVKVTVDRCARENMALTQMLFELAKVLNNLFNASVELNFKEKKMQRPVNKDVDL